MTVQLVNLASSDGFTIFGGAADDYAGYSVAAAGDVNDDGYEDVIVGSYGSGAAYVIYGKNSATRQNIDLANLTAQDGFVITGGSGEVFAKSVAGAGDVNNDGFADIAISDLSADNTNGINAGNVYVIFGAANSAHVGGVDVSTMTASEGVVILGPEATVGMGLALSSAGDLNGDGKDDLLIGSHESSNYDGAVFVVYGAAITTARSGSGTVNLSGLAPSDGTKIISSDAPGMQFGKAVSGGLDVNGDLTPDFLIGSPAFGFGSSTDHGAVTLVTDFSTNASPINSSAPSERSGLFLGNLAAGEAAGSDVAIVRDINGDSLADYVFSAPFNGQTGNDSGVVCVFYGTTAISSSTSSGVLTGMSYVQPSDGFVIFGGSSYAEIGRSISSAGDFNGDGIGDLLISVTGYGNANQTYTGGAYVVFGTTGTRGALTLTQMTTAEGLLLIGTTDDRTGRSVSSAGDINNDGFDDIIIGSPNGDHDVNGQYGSAGRGYDIGAAYVVYGYSSAPQPPSFNTITGTADPDNLTGTNGDDLIDGLAGGDVLSGGDGNDSIIGGDGDDIIYGDAGENTMAGGQGDDAYNIASANDIIQEDVNGGTDRVYTEFSHTLAANVEVLVLQGGSAFIGTGNALNNTIYGYELANTISGADGDDTILAGGGDDLVYGDAGNDVLDGGEGNDALYGGAGDDVFVANLGVSETVDGGAGNDTYQIASSSVQTSSYAVNLEAGSDQYNRVFSSIETVLGGDGDDTLTGRNDTAERLDGGAGSDQIFGNAGDDTVLGGNGNDWLKGGDGNDSLQGGNGNDSLFGDAGDNTLAGGDGNDLYYVDDADDVITESLNEGTDSVYASFSFTLGSNFENLFLAGSDSVNGTGNDLSNQISGNSAANALQGNAGNDQIFADGGDDTIDGGADWDYAFYGDTYVTGMVTYDLATDTFTVTTPSEGTDTVTNVEMFRFNGVDVSAASIRGTILDDNNNLWTGTVGDDVVRGLAGHDTLTTGNGNDVIFAGDGNDSVSAGAGNDSLEGGDGDDILMFGAGDDTIYGGAGNDFIDDVLNRELAGINLIDAGAGDDSVWAGMGNDTLIGGAGNDLLQGDSGADSIVGGDGADSLLGGAGDDTLTGGAGSDSFTVQGGTDSVTDLSSGDVLKVSGSSTALVTVATVWTATSATTNSGAAYLTTNGLAVNLAAATGYTGFNLTNIGTATTLTGSASADVLSGGDGADTLLGGAGNDSLRGGMEDDILNGGTGFDIAVYDGFGAAISVNLALTVAQDTGGWGWDRLISVEGLIGSVYNDLLTGDGFANWLEGGAGDDILTGAEGADSLLGGLGDDLLSGGAGNDVLTGGDGADTFSVSAGKDGVTDLGLGGADVLTVAAGATATVSLGADWTATSASSNAGTAVLTTNGYDLDLSAIASGTGFRVTNSGAGASLTGTLYADSLTGGTGADTLIGGAGNDSLSGGAGNDILTGGAGDDSLTGGGGFDSASYAGAASAVTVSLAVSAVQNSGGAGSDKLAAIEGLIGSDHGDTLTGDGFANRLEGGAGNDALTGAEGADTLLGGLGDDSLSGGAGNDVLTGGGGADTFTIGAGKDVISDLGGTDVLSVASGATATVTLGGAWTATSASSNAGTATLSTGGHGVDLSAITSGGKGFAVTNNGAAAMLIGTLYADSLTGGAGSDILLGGTGNDSLTGGAGADILSGGDGNDRLGGGDGSDVLAGGAGADSFVFTHWAGVDQITDFTSGSDTLLLSRSGIAGLGPVGTLSSAAFWTGSAAHDLTDRIIYNASTGALYYDADGTGSTAAIQVAVLDGQPALTYTDVLVF